MGDLWAYLTSPESRDTLSWLGGGLAAVAGAIWTVVTFLFSKPAAPKAAATPAPAPAQELLADRGAQAAGRDIFQNSGITTSAQNGLEGWQLVALVGVLAGLVLLAIAQSGQEQINQTSGTQTSTGAGSPNIGNVGGVATITSTVDQSEATTQGGNTAMADDTSAAVGGNVTGSTITVGD